MTLVIIVRVMMNGGRGDKSQVVETWDWWQDADGTVRLCRLAWRISTTGERRCLGPVS